MRKQRLSYLPMVTQEIVGKGNTKAIRITKRNATYTYFLLEEVKKKKKKVVGELSGGNTI